MSKYAELSPHCTTGSAARTALRHHVEKVRKALAGTETDSDRVEAVHKLRVASRRLSTALKVFEGEVPSKATDRLKRKARKIRRAAGDVRDLDILLGLVDEELRTSTGSARESFLCFAARLREEHRACSARLEKRLAAARADSFWTEIDRALGNRDEGRPLSKYVPEILNARLGAVARAWKRARTGRDVRLHELRIAFKELRYSLDLFRTVFGSEFPEAHYAVVEHAQALLGAVHDEHVLAERFSELAREAPESTARLRLELRATRRKAEWYRFAIDSIERPSLDLGAVSN